MASIDKNSLLSTHYLFQGLDAATVSRLAGLGIIRRLGNGEVLFQKGDAGDALYGVLSGKVRISTTSPGGRELILSIIDAGGVFGEISLLDGKPRSADATAMGETSLFLLRRAEFSRVLAADPRLTVHCLEMVCERLRTTNDLIEDAAFLPLPARLAKRLLSFSQSSVERGAAKAVTEIRISQSDLGQLLGTSRESINRRLQEWREEGWVDIGRGRVSILNHEALQEIVDFAADEE